MRQLLLVFALLGALSLTGAADGQDLKTNSVPLGIPGTLKIVTPRDWTLLHTNINPGDPPSVELHSFSNTIIIRLSIRWNAEQSLSPSEALLGQIVSNTVVRQYLPIAVEKTFALERFKGPEVVGCFARFTDAGWSPVVKNEYRNLTTGMFRCENIWGTFDLVTNDKDGPLFQAGLKVMESFRRTP